MEIIYDTIRNTIHFLAFLIGIRMAQSVFWCLDPEWAESVHWFIGWFSRDLRR